jgi:hypothetical protein
MGYTIYKFKWDNTDLKDYIRNSKYVAGGLRREAEILMKRAETIDMEMAELESSLIQIEDKAEG